ncbi:ATP-binding cassette sub-family D member 4-like [Galendromus occidentalis]|uniref:ATP-binding cassette sub-family D member 4-like n=1 Tax=Galendromus occidentalis TaxID=34638 RepID=A0AAJ6VX53_9ACAR|nr:ATP-binding cassette sub-family D member 4-like [Galendromus occidentalis]
MPPGDIKIELENVEFSKVPNIVAEVLKIFMTVLRRSKLLCSFVPSLCILEGIENGLDYHSGMLIAELVGVVTRQDTSAYSTLIVAIAGIALLNSVVGTCRIFLTAYANVVFRQVLTRKVHNMYFRNHNFYQVNCREKPLPNPDQRIGSDVDILGDYLCWMLSVIMTTPFTITYYFFQVGSTLGWTYSMIIVSYFFVIVFFSKVLRKPIIPRVCEKQKMEGRFRQQHLDVVENAERIAFVHGADAAEYRYTEQAFNRLVQASKVVQFLTIPVHFVMRLDSRMVCVVTALICGTHIFSTENKLSESDLSAKWTKIFFLVSQLATLCHKYVFIISHLINIEAMIRRIAELLDGMDDSSRIINEQGTLDTEPRYSLRNLTVVGPNGQVLVRELNIDFGIRHNILICGPSNVGKSSLLRVLRRLWLPAEGQVIFSGQSSQVMFVSQNMFFGAACGSLRKALTYPRDDAAIGRDTTDELLAVLMKLKLSHVLKRFAGDLDREIDEHTLSVLSSGERQRLSLARILFHRPKLAFLDEATNAVDRTLIQIFFRECKNLGITTVTVTHNREHLLEFHDRILELREDSTWTIKCLADNNSERETV